MTHIESTDPAVFVCRSCENVAVGERPARCCDRAMDAVATGATAVESPDLDQLLKVVFDMSGTELEVCLFVMSAREATAAEVATELDVDRSLVSRHLNHLAELGVVEKSRRLRREGGHVNVYTPVDQETVKRRLETELYRWFREAILIVHDLSREKVEAIAAVTDSSAEPRIYE